MIGTLSWAAYWATLLAITLGVNRWRHWLRFDRSSAAYLVGALMGCTMASDGHGAPWIWLLVLGFVTLTFYLWVALEQEKAQYAHVQDPAWAWRLRRRCGRVIFVSHYRLSRTDGMPSLNGNVVHLPHTCTRWRFHTGQHSEAHGTSLRRARASAVTCNPPPCPDQEPVQHDFTVMCAQDLAEHHSMDLPEATEAVRRAGRAGYGAGE